MKGNRSSAAWSRPRGEVAAAALLALGVAIERTRGRRAWMAAVPIILVNFVAFYGQLSYFRSHRQPVPGVVIPLPVSTAMALALESIAVYLAWQAHVARRAGDSALRLRLAAYLTALGIGALNYSHFAGPLWQPNAFAISFALASVISPALWGVHSNRESRGALKAQGLIEEHAVRLGFTRSFFHPLRSWVVRSRAAWTGENRPAEAIRLVDPPKWARSVGSTATATQTSLPVPPEREPRHQEPRRAAVAGAPVRAARAGGLAAAPETDRLLALELARSGSPLPGIQTLARTRHMGAPRARRILDLARAGMNGHGDDDHRS